MAIDIQLIVDPNSHCDPELKSDRRYTNMTSAEVHAALKKRGYTDDQLPSQRTLRDILNRMNYRLKRIRKAKPLKKTEHTDAIFENVKSVRQQAADCPETLEISVDTKAKVKLGEYSLGEKTRTSADASVPKALDHDPPSNQKLVPFGVLVLTTGLLTLVFGNKECSDYWGDCMRRWWQHARSSHRGIRKLVIYLDNGPKNSGVTRKFLCRMVEFADWSGLEVRLVYYPPYHSKYNPIERCWSALQRRWNGALLTCWQVARRLALRITWNSHHPTVLRINKEYRSEQPVTKTEFEQINSSLIRSEKLPKYDIIIKPRRTRGR